MKCPGQDSRYWKPGAIFEAQCPQCGHPVEFFKDDTTRRCGQCGHRFLNPAMDFGCASYCRYAEQCIGHLPPELLAQKQDLLKDRVAIEMKRHFGKDFKRIGHTLRVARHAEAIGREKGVALPVILVAAYLHDMGDRGEAARDPGQAREILTRLGAPEELIEQACDIIARLDRPGEDEPLPFRCVHDAVTIADLEERQKVSPLGAEDLARIIDNAFLTEVGKAVARKTLQVP